MKGIKSTGLVRNPLNKNYVAENPELEVQPFLTFAGQLAINGAIVETETVGEGEEQQTFEKSRVGFTINDISPEDLAEMQIHYDAIVTKCKTIVADKFKELNPTATFVY
ncbi:MAG: hypothetical protein K9H61_02235 [Bacteroidia bacterium]|nr:hypothetical protein [Bacteroidia bacterium]MCF8427144.1 hypothetical protein [Bacteroidia bacterium]MCF8445789.1 hypothetical protein [Bacteroidia bacterium]